MRNARFLLLALPVLAALGAVHCSGGDDNTDEPVPTDETGTDDGGETDLSETTPETGTDAPPDAVPDAPPPVTCTKAPSFAPALRVNHNPDSLRRVANAGMVRMADGRIMIAMLEALDTGSRYAVWARTVDPATSMISPDERLDVDIDALNGASALEISLIGSSAVAVRYGGSHLRVYSKGKWSPDLAATLSFAAGDDLGAAAAASGQVLVTRARAAAPAGQASVFRPDEGGVRGSWSAVQTLDLDASSGKPSRIDSIALSDGRFLTLVWHGAGGPSVRIRAVSGSWSTPSAKAELGAADQSPQYRLLDDGSIVLAALEGGGDTRRVVTSTWNSVDNWSSTRLLSKLPMDVNGVVPASPGPFLFGVTGSELEFVSWVAGCTAPARDCEFSAVTRRYSGGVWKDPSPLAIGEKRNGAEGVMVTTLDGGYPLVARLNTAKNNVELRVRGGTGDYTPVMTLAKDSPLFSPSTVVDARFHGSPSALWAVVRRETSPAGMPMVLPSALGRVDATAGTATWAPLTAGSLELRGFGEYPFVDGAGGFSVGAASATDGTTSAPVLAHSNFAGVSVDSASVIATGETSASFVNVPRGYSGQGRSAIYVVEARPSPTTMRLRAYAYNGVGIGVPQVLADVARAPRYFSSSGLLLFDCGGAVLYAADAMDGSYTLELVLVR